MLLPNMINTLMNLGPTGISVCARENGYRDAIFLEAKFVGITGNLNFCYEVKYKEDGEFHQGKVYLWQDTETGNIRFEY